MSAVKLTPNGDGTWSGGSLTICGVAYLLTFNREGCNGPCLTLTAEAGSSVSYTAVRDCCGPNYAIFSVGDPAVCSGTAACGGPSANVARIQIAWGQCGYAGAGWYCVSACGTTSPTYAVELTDADVSDTDIAIVSGPYSTEAAAQAVCPQDVTAAGSILTCAGATLPITPVGSYAVTIDHPTVGTANALFLLLDTLAVGTYKLTIAVSPSPSPPTVQVGCNIFNTSCNNESPLVVPGCNTLIVSNLGQNPTTLGFFVNIGVAAGTYRFTWSLASGGC